jgi:predicted enzyme related to lactoylglutathione lyase
VRVRRRPGPWVAYSFGGRHGGNVGRAQRERHHGAHMKRVTGIGGVFFRASDPAALGAWYKAHLGIDVQPWGGAAFSWADDAGQPVSGTTAWCIGDGRNFAPGTAPFMVNYRVADLRGLLDALRAEGCRVLDAVEESEYGAFGWVIDPEGNKVELWQPPPGQ